MIEKIEGAILETDLDSNFNEIIFSMLANKINEIIDVLNNPVFIKPTTLPLDKEQLELLLGETEKQTVIKM